MSVYHIRKGRNINLKGAAEKRVDESALPAKIAIKPQDFCGLKPRLLVKPDSDVQVGTPILEDKLDRRIHVVSPVSGRVVGVNRGEKRILEEIVIATDGKQKAETFSTFTAEHIETMSREDVLVHLLKGGVWPCIRQRPFSKIAHPADLPKSIFVQATNTDPLALDVDVILKDREKEFQTGLNVLTKLTQGPVYLCTDQDASSLALTVMKNVTIHQFSGAHPAGNVSTLIHQLDPIGHGELVWYVRAEDVLRIGILFDQGIFLPDKYVAVTGEGAANRGYKKTVLGVPVMHLLEGQISSGMRYISGSVLSGTVVGEKGFVSFYDSQLTVIPEGGNRELIGWLLPGFNKYTFSKTFASVLRPDKEPVSLNADENGGHRAIVLNHLYDDYITLDIPTYFLLKAIIGGDIEEAERLGLLECDEEDFALCTFACPSKTDVGGIIRQGLDLIEKEG